MDAKVKRSEIRPANPADLPALWGWIQADASQHLDDFGPQSLEAFKVAMADRMAHGERLYAIEHHGRYVGAIGYLPLNPVTGMLHGVTIAPDWQRQGIGRAAIAAVLEIVKAEGVRKVCAQYFADNSAIRACLKRCGFVDEGFLQDQTRRDGLPLSAWMVGVRIGG